MNIKFISFFYFPVAYTEKYPERPFKKVTVSRPLQRHPHISQLLRSQKRRKTFLNATNCVGEKGFITRLLFAFRTALIQFSTQSMSIVWWRAAECCSVVMVLVIRFWTLLEDLWTIWSCCLYVFYYYHILSYSLCSIFYQCIYGFIPV
jgi:hypothetical protein